MSQSGNLGPLPRLGRRDEGSVTPVPKFPQREITFRVSPLRGVAALTSAPKWAKEKGLFGIKAKSAH
jgi:hypothetical protein